jgi:hypothetical protein
MNQTLKRPRRQHGPRLKIFPRLPQFLLDPASYQNSTLANAANSGSLSLFLVKSDTLHPYLAI